LISMQSILTYFVLILVWVVLLTAINFKNFKFIVNKEI
jgi:hypothetical protein